MKILFIPFFLLTNLFISAQSYAPLGAKWTHGTWKEIQTPLYYPRYPTIWSTIKDTMVLGKTCQLTKREGNWVPVDISDKLITYEDSGVVYWYSEKRNDFSVFIDFNALAGDTWISYYDFSDSCDVEIRIDSTEIISINGHSLKRMFASIPQISPNYAFAITELFGFEAGCGPHLGERVYSNCSGWIIDGGGYMKLRCYEDSSLGFYDFGTEPDCDYNTIGINELQHPHSLELFPNPASDHIRFKVPDLNSDLYSFVIYNSTGELKLKGDFSRDKETDISQLTSGIYFVLVKSSSGNYSNKFVKTGVD